MSTQYSFPSCLKTDKEKKKSEMKVFAKMPTIKF